MVDTQSLDDVVIDILREHLGISPEKSITLDMSLRDDLGADDLDFLELELEFEERFTLTLNHEEVGFMSTPNLKVSDIVSFLTPKVDSTKS